MQLEAPFSARRVQEFLSGNGDLPQNEPPVLPARLEVDQRLAAPPRRGYWRGREHSCSRSRSGAVPAVCSNLSFRLLPGVKPAATLFQFLRRQAVDVVGALGAKPFGAEVELLLEVELPEDLGEAGGFLWWFLGHDLVPRREGLDERGVLGLGILE